MFKIQPSEYIKGEIEKMTITRNYLTAEEIGAVVESMLDKDNEYERQMVKYGILGQLLVDGIEITDEDDCNTIYTKLVEGGIDLDKNITNIELVDKIVDKELGVAKVVEGILNGVITRAEEELKNIDLKATLVELDKLSKGEGLNSLKPV